MLLDDIVGTQSDTFREVLARPIVHLVLERLVILVVSVRVEVGRHKLLKE